MNNGFWRNAGFAVVGRGLSVGLGFVATPFIIGKVGVNGFGAWALLESIIAYFSLSDMGIGSSFTKHVAQFHATRDDKNVSRVVSAGLLFYVILSLFLVSGSLLLEGWVVGKFDFTTISLEDVHFIYMSLVVVMCIRMTSMPFWSVVTGALRYDTLNQAKMFAQLVHFAGLLAFLGFGYGLKGLAANAVIYAGLDIALAVTIAFRVAPRLSISFGRGIGETFAQLLRYGLAIQLVAISEIINNQIDKVFLGMFSGVSFVGMYEIGAKIANVTNSLAGVVLPILVPTISQLNAAGHEGEIRSLYIRGTKFIALIVMPVVFVVFFHADSLVRLWLGKEGFEAAGIAARLLTAGLGLYLIAGVGRLVSRGIGIPKYEMQAGVLISVLNLSLSYIMIRKWGLPGAVISSFFSLAVGSVYFVVRFNGQIHVPNSRMLRLFLMPAIFSALAVVPTVILAPSPADIDLLRGMTIRLQAFLYLSAVSGIGVAIYFCCLFIASFTDEYGELRAYIRKRNQ